jgi:hypothetical protein
MIISFYPCTTPAIEKTHGYKTMSLDSALKSMGCVGFGYRTSGKRKAREEEN